MKIYIFSVFLLLGFVFNGCKFCDCDEHIDQLNKQITDLKAKESLKQTVLSKMNNKVGEYNKLRDSLEVYKDSVSTIIERIKKSKKSSAGDNATLNRLMQEMNRLLKSNQELAGKLHKEMDSLGYKEGDLVGFMDVLSKSMNDKIAEVNQLKSQIITLQTEVKSLTLNNKQLQETNIVLTESNTELNTKVTDLTRENQEAKRLIIDFEKAEFLNEKQKTVLLFENTKIIKFKFSIRENIVADPGTRKVYVRVSDPVTGKIFENGFFVDKDGFEKGYTLAADCEYNNKDKKYEVIWNTDVKQLSKKVKYDIDFWIDGQMVEQSKFVYKE